MQGRIVKGIAGFYYVDTEDGIFECRAKGIFRNQKVKPLVGDLVELEVLSQEEKEGSVISILPRKSELIRPAVANVDQALVIFALSRPTPNLPLLDRFLIMMKQKEIPTIICFNKSDMVSEEEREHFRQIYRDCGSKILFISAKKWKQAATYTIIYLASWLTYTRLVPLTTGAINFILLGCSGMLSRFLPGIAMGGYLVSTTTVSEFTAAMLRMRLSEKIIIPLSVMFRFFPTVMDEAASINAAMKMRGIHIGGRNAGKMLEYRLVPLMTCCVKIGEELSAAALTRGLGGEVRRTNICKIGFHIQDYLLFVVCMIPYAVWIMGRVL